MPIGLRLEHSVQVEFVFINYFFRDARTSTCMDRVNTV